MAVATYFAFLAMARNGLSYTVTTEKDSRIITLRRDALVFFPVEDRRAVEKIDVLTL